MRHESRTAAFACATAVLVTGLIGWSAAQADSGAAPRLAANPATTMPPVSPGGASTFTLAQLIERARVDSPALAAVRAEALAARAGITSARAYPNPELLAGGSSSSARLAGAPAGSGGSIGLTQRIESPSLRDARSRGATASAEGAQHSVQATEQAVIAAVKIRFFDVLRVQELAVAAREDLALTEQIQARISVRVATGEAPRFDLIRAETEAATALTTLRQREAELSAVRAQLRELVAPSLPEAFEVEGNFHGTLEPADSRLLRESTIAAHPELRLAQAERERARWQLEAEQASVMPGVDLFLVRERTPDLDTTRAGLGVRIPLLDRRVGPIEEARQRLLRADALAAQRQFELRQRVEAAWHRYESARTTVATLENGVLAKAQAVLGVAEAAYRYGERGILEYLDAQRQYRLLRNELITSRFEAFAAQAELERLASTSLPGA